MPDDTQVSVADTAIADTPHAPPASELGVVDPLHYSNRKLLSQGGMGRIVTAFDRRLNRVVALKELRKPSEALVARFEREVLLTALLEHPSIVTVHEAGRWPSGEPFYAMRLVPGRSLEDVIRDARDLPARLACLPHVIAVADALAYAHGKRVIHRDLKPGNVMVGDFGETVVIDWGLAKRLDQRRQSSTDLHAADSPQMTEAGDVLGTPAYMPVEQAAGEVVDARADVYAIGAILYHALAGRAPYTGSANDVIAALLDAPPVPLEKLAPDAPPDLLAIVRRAMARDASARYPTARELADDLRKFQAGQLVGAHRYSLRELLRRWLARNRRVLAVVAVAAAALVAFGAYSLVRIVRADRAAQDARVVAERQRASAEDRRHEVEELMSFMLVDLRDKLQSVGHIEMLGPVAHKAADYYAKQPEVHDDAERGHRMRALANVGEALLQQGDTAGAMSQYAAVIALAKRPDLALAQAQIGLGDVLHTRGDSAEALAQYRAALATGEQLDRAAEGVISALAIAHERIGDVSLVLGDARTARAEYHQDLELERSLADTPEARRDIAVSHQRLANTELAAGHVDEALAEYREMQKIIDDVVRRAPRDPMRMRDAAGAHENIGDVLSAKGDHAAALAEYRTDLALMQRAADIDRGDALVERDLAIAHNKVGEMLRRTGDAAGALADQRAALAIDEQLVAGDPDDTASKRELGVSHVKIGDALLERGDPHGALAEYRSALAIRDALLVKDPHNATWRRDQYVANDDLSGALLALGDRAGAIAALRSAVAQAAALAATEPDNAKWQGDVASLRGELAKLTGARAPAAGPGSSP